MNNVKYGMSTFIGETTYGLPYPVFYDPHYPLLNNRGPVSLVTGSPGSGKTFFSLLVAAHASILGKTNIAIDIKGDFRALKGLSNKGWIGETEIWKLSSKGGDVAEENVGILDPTVFYKNVNDNITLTKDCIKTLCDFPLTHTQITTLTPIITDVVAGANPSFDKIVAKLLSNRNDEVRVVGYSLQAVLGTSSAKLLVTNKRITRKPLMIENKTVVVDLEGISLPDVRKSKEAYSSKERIGMTIFSLVCTLVLDMMKDIPSTTYKMITVDEAWAIFANPIGYAMALEVARLGRSKNLACLLATQSTQAIDDENSDINSMISTRFAFKNDDEKEVEKTIRLMKLPSDEGWEKPLMTQPSGSCLFQDCLGNTGFVSIMANEAWVDYFDTTPDVHKEKK